RDPSAGIPAGASADPPTAGDSPAGVPAVPPAARDPSAGVPAAAPAARDPAAGGPAGASASAAAAVATGPARYRTGRDGMTRGDAAVLHVSQSDVAQPGGMPGIPPANSNEVGMEQGSAPAGNGNGSGMNAGEARGGSNGGKGSLVVVGTGIRTVGQMTIEAVAWIKQADKVLYVVSDPVAELMLRELNPKAAESMTSMYAEGKPRILAYNQMIERTLECVRGGMLTCMACYGHPGVFVYPSHESIRRARAEGYPARMLPAVSSEDC